MQATPTRSAATGTSSLSERRARAVWACLHDFYQVEGARKTAVGKGEPELLLPDQPDAAPNRRVRVTNQC
jgi:flagellar motor protein MotB